MRDSKIIAIDLDGTLAHYDGWKGPGIIGDPIPEMVEKVKKKVVEGYDFWIFTARVSNSYRFDNRIEFDAISKWLCDNAIPIKTCNITATKHKFFCEFWDDRARRVVPNTGMFQEEWDDRNSIPQLGI